MCEAPSCNCDSDIVKEVEGLVQDIAEFATNLAQDLADFIDSLPTPSKLIDMAVDFVKKKLLGSDGLCVRPYCGGHINSGTEQNLVPAGIDGVEADEHGHEERRSGRGAARSSGPYWVLSSPASSPSLSA